MHDLLVLALDGLEAGLDGGGEVDHAVLEDWLLAAVLLEDLVEVTGGPGRVHLVLEGGEVDEAADAVEYLAAGFLRYFVGVGAAVLCAFLLQEVLGIADRQVGQVEVLQAGDLDHLVHLGQSLVDVGNVLRRREADKAEDWKNEGGDEIFGIILVLRLVSCTYFGFLHFFYS